MLRKQGGAALQLTGHLGIQGSQGVALGEKTEVSFEFFPFLFFPFHSSSFFPFLSPFPSPSSPSPSPLLPLLLLPHWGGLVLCTCCILLYITSCTILPPARCCGMALLVSQPWALMTLPKTMPTIKCQRGGSESDSLH